MRDFKDFNSKGDTNNNANILKAFAEKYEGATETELISAILKEAEKGRRNGTLKDGDIDKFASMLAPMLNSSQRQQLEKVVKQIKKI